MGTLSPELLAVLACPSADHAPLDLVIEGDVETLVCTVCRSTFEIRESIPVLLPDEARPGPNGLGVKAG